MVSSKTAADLLVRAAVHTHGFPGLITRCSNNYGPYQFPEKLIPLVILNALEGRAVPVYGDGSNVRDWLYVDDHARALAAIVTRGRVGESYNVGGREERTNLQVVEAVCDALDARVPLNGGASRRSLITFVADRPGHDRRYAIDHSLLTGEMGWRPAHDFRAGLAETVAWYLDHRDWLTGLAERGVAGDRLGLKKTTEASA